MTTPATGTPALDTATDAAPEVDRVTMLELDLPEPGLPAWALAVIGAIRAIVVGVTMATADAAFRALGAAIQPAGLQPNGPAKDAVRTAKDEKLAEINAVIAACKATPAPAPVHTVEQAIPVVRPVTPQVAALPGMTPLGAPVLALVPPTVAAPVPARPLLTARWQRLPGGDEWGARIDAGDPRIGDAVDLYRARDVNRRSPERRYLASRHVLTSGGVVFGVTTVRNATDTAPIAAPAPADPLASPAQHTAPTGEWTSVPVEDGPAETFATTLGNIAAESSHNASAAPIGSLAGGQLRFVGFSSADGYIEAIRRGVTTATHASYLTTLRGQYGYTDAAIEALALPGPQLGVAVDNSLPVGPGITHTPVGPSYADMTPAQRRALRKVGEEARATVRKLITESTLIAGIVGEGSFLQAAWVGGGSTTLRTVREALATIGREGDAPKAPSAEKHAGKAVDSIRNRDYDTARLPATGLPEGIKARWLVGRKLTGAAITAGMEYGRALLIVSLGDNDALTFDGDQHLAGACNAHYIAATGAEAMHSDTMTAWLSGLLHKAHYAVKRGPHWYVPPGEAAAARALLEAIEPLWGDHDRIPVTTGADLFRNLTRGLGDEVAAVVKEYNQLTEVARERARKAATVEAEVRISKSTYSITDETRAMTIAAAVATAEAKACVSPEVGARLLADLAAVAAKVDGYAGALGDEKVTGIRATITTLTAALVPTCTAADQRSHMLELRPL